MLGALIALVVASGCYGGGSNHDHAQGNGEIREGEHNMSSDSYRSTEHDHGQGWGTENDEGSSEDNH